MFSCCSTRIKTETKLQLNFETGVNCGIVLKKRDKLDKKTPSSQVCFHVAVIYSEIIAQNFIYYRTSS